MVSRGCLTHNPLAKRIGVVPLLIPLLLVLLPLLVLPLLVVGLPPSFFLLLHL